MNDTDKKVADALSAAMIGFSAKYQGEQTRDGWQCDAWLVTFTPFDDVNQTFDYYTGLGHRSKPKTKYDLPRPRAPSAAGVLYSLLLDSQAANQNFHDWCDDFGYDNGSKKATAIYEACLVNARKLRAIGLPDTIAGMLEDY